MIPIRPFNRENALHYGAYFAARLLPYPLLRRGVAAVIRTGVNARQGVALGDSGSAAMQTTLKKLRDEGMSAVECPLNTAQMDEILAFLAVAPTAQGASGQPVSADTEGVSFAAYDLPTILACPHLLKVMNHPDVIQMATAFLGCKPTISGVGLRWSFADGKSESDVQKFHRDTEDWKILRLFIYLTDVSPGSGPHQFVTESHKTAGRFRLKPYLEQDIDSRFGRDKVVTVVGPRGTAFVGDMWGVHRGVPPTERPRLLFNCTYTMTATPLYRYDPVSVPDSHLYDRYTNRLLIHAPSPGT